MQLLGCDDSHLVVFDGGHRLHPLVGEAFAKLQIDAREAGFELAIASAHRSFERQCAIFNGKARGERPVHDDRDQPLDMTSLSPEQRLEAILRFSAIPGTSRHHWGTDLDVYDAAAMPEGYALQLSPGEVAPGGLFDPLHGWLDARMEAGESHGFYRPYARDRGGVAPERWHLSYAPLACRCETLWDAGELSRLLVSEGVELLPQLTGALDSVLARYVAVPADWCPAQYR